MWIYLIVTVVGLLITFVGAMGVLGSRLPVQHVAAASVVVKGTPDAVFDVVADVPGHAKWAEGIDAVNVLPDKDGKKAYEMVMGRNKFALLATVTEKPTQFTMTMDDGRKFFWGDWTYRLTPQGDGTKVVLTETGNVNSAIPRAMMHYLFGKHMYLKKNMNALAKKFGDASPQVMIEKVD